MARWGHGFLMVAMVSSCAAAPMVDQSQDPAIVDLPRPGYEPRRIHIGAITIAPEAAIRVDYDDNVFASRQARSDAVFTFEPEVRITRDTGKLKIDGQAFGLFRRYADYKTENIDSGGIRTKTRYSPSAASTIDASLDLERGFELRSDPEATTDPFRKPARINIARGELRYAYRPGRIGVTATAGAQLFDYLPRIDSDRDLTLTYLTLRGSWQLSAPVDLFVEGFANRRNAHDRVDRDGIDRDALTTGVLAGAAIDLGGKLRGELGLGAFRMNPGDPSLRAFTGVAASGSLTWRPRVRTALQFDLSRRDVATIRAGATGRTDMIARVRIDQEVRHNLILSGGLGVRDTRYRGVSRGQQLYTAEIEALYMVGRHLGLIASGLFAKRDATRPDERFERFRVGIGARVVY